MDKQAEADKMVVIGCCSTGSASGGHRAGTPPLLEPALQQSIKTILSVSAYLSASAASLVQGRWIYHKSTGPIGEWPGQAYGGRSNNQLSHNINYNFSLQFAITVLRGTFLVYAFEVELDFQVSQPKLMIVLMV